MRFNRNELDGLDTPDKYPEKFGVVLSLKYQNVESPIVGEEAWFNRREFDSQMLKAQPNTLFNATDEMNHVMQTFRKSI